MELPFPDRETMLRRRDLKGEQQEFDFEHEVLKGLLDTHMENIEQTVGYTEAKVQGRGLGQRYKCGGRQHIDDI